MTGVDYVSVTAAQLSGGASAAAATPSFSPMMDPRAQSFEAADGVVAMAISGSHDGGGDAWLALANGGMEVRDVHSGRLRHNFTAPVVRRPSASTRVWCLVAICDETVTDKNNSSADGSCGAAQMWVGLSTGTIEVYDSRTFQLIRQLRKHLSGVYCLAAEQTSAADPRTRAVYSGSSDFQIAQWRVCDGRLLRVLSGHSNYVRCLYAEGSVLISGSDDGTVKVWDRDTGAVLRTGTFHILANQGNTSNNNIDGDASATTANSNRNAASPYTTAKGCGVSVLCRVGVNVWSGDESGTVVVWRLKDCAALLVSRPHSGRVTSLRMVGSQVYSAGADGAVCVFAALDGTLARRLLPLPDSPDSNNSGGGGGVGSRRLTAVQCAAQVDRHYLWTASADHTVRCWHHDEHTAMSEAHERVNDMRWYYTTTQPFHDSNERLLDEHRDLSELVVLASGSDEAVRAYLSRNSEVQSVAARYWTLERRVRESQADTQRMEEERRAVEAAAAARQSAFAIAQSNLKAILEAQQQLRSSWGLPPALNNTSTGPGVAPVPVAPGATPAAAVGVVAPIAPPAPLPPLSSPAAAVGVGVGAAAAGILVLTAVPPPTAAAAPLLPTTTLHTITAAGLPTLGGVGPTPLSPSALLPAGASHADMPLAAASAAALSYPSIVPVPIPHNNSSQRLQTSTGGGGGMGAPVRATTATVASHSLTSLQSGALTHAPPHTPTPAAAVVVPVATTNPSSSPSSSPWAGVPVPISPAVKVVVSTSYEPVLSALPPPPPPPSSLSRGPAGGITVVGVPPASVPRSVVMAISASGGGGGGGHGGGGGGHGGGGGGPLSVPPSPGGTPPASRPSYDLPRRPPSA